jgi:hypothetical protein
MNFYEAQDFFKKLYPDVLVSFEFDEKCHRFYEFVMTDGLPNDMHHIECHKVKVTIPGMPIQYVPIQPHRLTCDWNYMNGLISSKTDK